MLREWFCDYTYSFVDEFVKSNFLCWTSEFVKQLHKYVQNQRRKAVALKEDNIVDMQTM
jgi:hypothetical protein